MVVLCCSSVVAWYKCVGSDSTRTARSFPLHVSIKWIGAILEYSLQRKTTYIVDGILIWGGVLVGLGPGLHGSFHKRNGDRFGGWHYIFWFSKKSSEILREGDCLKYLTRMRKQCNSVFFCERIAPLSFWHIKFMGILECATVLSVHMLPLPLFTARMWLSGRYST